MSNGTRVVTGILTFTVIVLAVLYAINSDTNVALTKTNETLSNRCDLIEQALTIKADARAVAAVLDTKANSKDVNQVLGIHNMRLSVTELAIKKKVGDRRWAKHVQEVLDMMREQEAKRQQALAVQHMRQEQQAAKAKREEEAKSGK